MRRGATFFAEPHAESKGETIYLWFPMFVDTQSDSRFADGGPVQTFSEGGPAQVRLAEAIAERMELTGEREADAERNLVRTEAGLELWEVARQERMEY